jgi:hypothetical protein
VDSDAVDRTAVDKTAIDTAALARTAVMAGRVVVGGGTLVAPRRMAPLFGIDADANPAVGYVGRLFGVRALLQVALLATASAEERARQLRWGIAVDAVDALAAAAAGRSGDLSKGAATRATAAALLEGALGLVALSAGRGSRRR